MFCPSCGSEIPEGVKFCPSCGAFLQQEPEAAAPAEDASSTWYEPASESPAAPEAPAAPVYTPSYEPPAQPVPSAPAYSSAPAAAPNVLLWGILGLAFACSFFASFLGIIFSAKAKSMAADYERWFGPVHGKERVGFNLAKAGFIVGIILTILFAIYLTVIIIAAVLAATY